MSNNGYWSFDERHPKPDGRLPLSARIGRFIDRIDDSIVAWQSHWEYLRIRRTTGLRA